MTNKFKFGVCKCGCENQVKTEGKQFLVGHNHRGKKRSLATRLKMREAKLRNIESAIRNLPKDVSGKNNPNYGKKRWHSKRIKYKGISFKSTWESALAKIMDLSGISWQYEPDRFYFDDCTYCPDFKIADDFYIEVKGFMTHDGQKRIDKFREKYPEKTLLVYNRELLEPIFNSYGVSLNNRREAIFNE